MTNFPHYDFSGKRVLITCSNSGIGLETAKIFAASGAHVALNSFTDTPEDHGHASALAQSHGVTAVYLQADLSDMAQATGLVARAQEALGGVDILVNNAGIQHIAPVDSFADDAWKRVVDINLNAQFQAIKAVLPAMKSAGWGRIVNIASAHGLHASANKSAYVAAKHGVVGLSKTVAIETAEEGTTCNAICPGYVYTPIIQKQIPDIMEEMGLDEQSVVRDVLLVKQPSKSFISMEEISAAVLYLSSDAARSITGTAISIDGGWSAI